ncbi:MAG: DUF3267 domain-containing protein [Clostridia bacterium]|nr:DUF3267 domain-containing protein [Clostridia bacterium]
MQNVFSELPENYEEVFHIDARNKKTGLIFNLVALIPFAIVLAIVRPTARLDAAAKALLALGFGQYMLRMGIYLLAFVGSLIAYLILHELTHGVVYKAMTKRKLTFGMSWSCAFCGVPDAYVSRKTAIAALIAPFTLFTLVFLPLTIVFAFVDPWLYLLFGLLLGLHLGGCSGDLYMTYLLLFRYKNKALLMRDTGPEQWLYLPQKN